MAITNKIGSGLKGIGAGFVDRQVQEKNEKKFSGQVDKAYHQLHVAGNKIVGFLKNTAFETLKAPMINPFTLAQPKKDEDGEIIPLTVMENTRNFHKNVLMKTDEVARNAGEIANTLTCKLLSPIERVADALNHKNVGSMIQHSVALVVQAVVRAVFFVVGQLAHLKTPLKAMAYAVLALVTVVIPHVACLMLAIKANKQGKEIAALRKEIKQINKPVLQKVKQAISNNKKTAAALLAATLVAGAVYYYGVPSVVSSAASFVSGKATAAGSTIGGYFATAGSTVASTATSAGSTVVGAVKSGASTVIGKAASAGSTAAEFAKPFGATVLSYGNALLGKVTVKNTAIGLGAAATLGAATVVGYRKGAVSKVVNGGKAVIRSISMPSKKQALVGGATTALTVGAIGAYLFGVPSLLSSAINTGFSYGSSFFQKGRSVVGF